MSHPDPLCIRRLVLGTRADEQRLHRALARWHRRGEWFDYAGQVAEWLAGTSSPRWHDEATPPLFV